METISNGIDAPSVAVLDFGGRAALKASLGIDPSGMVIGAIGRMVEQKRFSHCVRAFAQLCHLYDKKLYLLLVGDGPLRADLLHQAQHEGISDRVSLPGFRRDVSELLQIIDVVVFSSIYEGLPVALLEAMAAGRCIVTTDAAGIMDAVTNEREALIVPALDTQRLCDAIRRVLIDEPLRERLRENARRRFLDEFTAERMIKEYERVYREVSEGAVGSGARAASSGISREPKQRQSRVH